MGFEPYVNIGTWYFCRRPRWRQRYRQGWRVSPYVDVHSYRSFLQSQSDPIGIIGDLDLKRVYM